jgi:hypothetical protein
MINSPTMNELFRKPEISTIGVLFVNFTIITTEICALNKSALKTE